MSVRQLDQNQDIQPAPCHYMNASFNGFFKWFQDGWGSSSSSSFTIVVNTFSLVSGLILGTIRRLYLCTDNKPTSSPIGNYVRPTDRPTNQRSDNAVHKEVTLPIYIYSTYAHKCIRHLSKYTNAPFQSMMIIEAFNNQIHMYALSTFLKT